MCRGVEKARVAFAAAENGANKIARRLVRLSRCSSFGRFRRGHYTAALGGVGGGGLAKRSGFRVSHAEINGVPQRRFASGSSMADGARGIGFTLGIMVTG